MTVPEAIAAFLFHCRYEKNLSPKTLRAYETDLRQFSASLAADPGTAVASVERAALRGYIQGLYAEYKEKSIKRKVATLKAFFRFLEREDTIAASPFRKMDIRIRETRRLPRTLTLAEMQQVLLVLYARLGDRERQGERAYLARVRDVAVVELLFATGARVSEACSLPASAVDLDAGTVLLMGKGSRERTVPVADEQVLAILREYARLDHGGAPAEGFFFRNARGGRLAEQSVRALLRRFQAQLGLGFRLTPHVIRHSVATLLLEEGVDLRSIQTLLGHTSIATTQIYTHVNDRHQRETLTMRHPRRRMQRLAADV